MPYIKSSIYILIMHSYIASSIRAQEECETLSVRQRIKCNENKTYNTREEVER